MRRQRGIGAGSASILVILVVLCLTTFATLSLVSARADLRLSRRTAQTLTDYYAADYTATALLVQLSGALETVDPSHGEQVYLSLCAERLSNQLDTLTLERQEGLTARFLVPIDGRRALSAAFQVVYPPRQNGARLWLLEWKTVDTAEWEGDESIGLWQGGEEFLDERHRDS